LENISLKFMISDIVRAGCLKTPFLAPLLDFTHFWAKFFVRFLDP
jgi:hypothetical protein